MAWSDRPRPRGRLASAVAGAPDADHWTVATPFSRKLPLAGALFHDGVPHAMVIEAALEVIVEVLGSAAR